MGAGELLLSVAGAIGGLFGIRAGVEEPSYRLDQTLGAVEVRTYAPRLTAQTEVDGEREAALNEGFSRIADYIFGANASRSTIAMTAPVVQAPASETIAMTAPVVQTEVGANRWSVRFIMPAKYNASNLPRPRDPRVTIVEAPAHRYAVLRFSGSRTPQAVERRKDQLLRAIAGSPLRTTGPVEAWFYDPPWTPPFLRRNEVAAPIG